MFDKALIEANHEALINFIILAFGLIDILSISLLCMHMV
jgi:nitrate reductase NapE component